MMTATVTLLVLIGVPTLLRFCGFAEPIAALAGALAAACLVTSFDPNMLAGPLDFNRIDYIYLAIMVLTVIGSLLAGCHAAPRANRPLGWYAPGDAGFIGALLVAIVLGGVAFQVSIVNLMVPALIIGVVLWLAMAGAGALLGRRSSEPPPVASLSERIAIGFLAVVLIVLPSVLAMLAGLLTPSEAFAFLGLPAALAFRLVAGLIQGRGIAGFGTDVLRGIADGAWIILTAFVAQTAAFAYVMSGPTSSALPLSVWLMPAFAVAVLSLGFIVGPTYGALLAIVASAPLLTAAGMAHDSCALVAGLMLMLGYARPAFGLSLLSPAPGGAPRRLPAAEVGAMALGAVIVVGVAAAVAAMAAGY